MRMSENQEDQPRRPVRRRRRSWQKRLRSAFPWPTRILSAIGAIQTAFWEFKWIKRAWEWAEHVFSAKDIIREMGVDMPLVVAIASSPLFGVTLIVIGLAYGIAVPENKRISNRSPYSAVAWLIVGISTIIIVSSILFYSFISSTGVQNAVAAYSPFRIPQRHLSQEQKEKIIACAKPISATLPQIPQMPAILIGSTNDNESGRYSREIYSALKEGRLPVYVSSGGTQDPGEVGVMVELVDPEHQSALAKSVIGCIESAGISVKTELWIGHEGPDNPDFSLFVTRPIPADD